LGRWHAPPPDRE